MLPDPSSLEDLTDVVSNLIKTNSKTWIKLIITVFVTLWNIAVANIHASLFLLKETDKEHVPHSNLGVACLLIYVFRVPVEQLCNRSDLCISGEPDKELNPKKKVWEQVQPDLRTDAQCVAIYKGAAFEVAGKGVCKSQTMSNSGIK